MSLFVKVMQKAALKAVRKVLGKSRRVRKATASR